MAEVEKPKVMQTSSSVAHGFKKMQFTGYEQRKRLPKCPKVLQSLLEDPMLQDNVISEMKRQYTYKADETARASNPMVKKLVFMKPLVETRLNFVSRNIIPQRSTSHHDYSGKKSEIMEPTPPVMPAAPSPIRVTPIVPDPTSPNYIKYLDPAATTYTLSYPFYTSGFIEGSLSRKDNITFYNWNTIYKPKKNVFPVTEATNCEVVMTRRGKKKETFASKVQHVPNRGLMSEAKSKYIDPLSHPEYIPVEKPTKQYIINIDPVDTATITEAMTYGSGERVEKFV